MPGRWQAFPCSPQGFRRIDHRRVIEWVLPGKPRLSRAERLPRVLRCPALVLLPDRPGNHPSGVDALDPRRVVPAQRGGFASWSVASSDEADWQTGGHRHGSRSVLIAMHPKILAAAMTARGGSGATTGPQIPVSPSDDMLLRCRDSARAEPGVAGIRVDARPRACRPSTDRPRPWLTQRQRNSLYLEPLMPLAPWHRGRDLTRRAGLRRHGPVADR